MKLLSDLPVEIPPEKNSLGFEPLVKAFLALLTDPRIAMDSSFSIALYGEWGAGKSSLINQIKAVLDLYDDEFVTLKFNAWMFEDEPSREESKPPRLFFPLLLELGRISGKTTQSKAIEIVKVLSEGILDTIFKSWDKSTITFKLSPKIISKFLDNSQTEMHVVDYINEINELIFDITDAFNKKLIIFIEDLGRCDSEAIVELLEDLLLLMKVPKTIFVITADWRALRRSLKEHFSRAVLNGKNKNGQSNGEALDEYVEKYLSKFFQLEYWMPKPFPSVVSSWMEDEVKDNGTEVENIVKSVSRKAISDKRNFLSFFIKWGSVFLLACGYSWLWVIQLEKYLNLLLTKIILENLLIAIGSITASILTVELFIIFITGKGKLLKTWKSIRDLTFFTSLEKLQILESSKNVAKYSRILRDKCHKIPRSGRNTCKNNIKRMIELRKSAEELRVKTEEEMSQKKIIENYIEVVTSINGNPREVKRAINKLYIIRLKDMALKNKNLDIAPTLELSVVKSLLLFFKPEINETPVRLLNSLAKFSESKEYGEELLDKAIRKFKLLVGSELESYGLGSIITTFYLPTANVSAEIIADFCELVIEKGEELPQGQEVFIRSNFQKRHIERFNLDGWKFSKEVTFDQSELKKAIFQNVEFREGVEFVKSNLTGANFVETNFTPKASFEGSDLAGSTFDNVTFGFVNFKDANLRNARFRKTTFTEVNPTKCSFANMKEIDRESAVSLRDAIEIWYQHAMASARDYMEKTSIEQEYRRALWEIDRIMA